MKKFIVLTFAIVLISVHILGVTSAATTEPLVQATFSTNPTTVNPGNDGYLQLTLKNTGTAASDRITISSVSSDTDIIPSGNWVGQLSPLGAGESVTSLFKFTVSESATSGLHSLTFFISYGVDSTSKTINPTAIINVQSPSKLELTSINPSSLIPGERANMTFTIANKGSNPVNNVVFTWTSSGNTILPLGSDNRVIIPTIYANSHYDIQVEVSVSPSATPGLYPLTIFTQYSDKSGTNQSISSTAGVEIGGETDFDVSVQDSTSTSTTLAIANIGTNIAYSAIVTIPQQENFRVTGVSTNVMGNLNAGDYTLTSFQITQTGNITNISAGRGFQVSPNRNATSISAGLERNNLVVEISYTDALGIRRTLQKQVRLDAVSSIGSRTTSRLTQESQSQILGSNGLIYVGIGLVGIVAIVVFFKFRKRIKRKKE